MEFLVCYKVQTKLNKNSALPAPSWTGDGGHLHQDRPHHRHAGSERSLVSWGRRWRGLDKVERSRRHHRYSSGGRRQILGGDRWGLFWWRRVHQAPGRADWPLVHHSPLLLLGILRTSVLHWRWGFCPGLWSQVNLYPLLVLSCHNGNSPTSIGKSYQIESLLAVCILDKHLNIWI